MTRSDIAVTDPRDPMVFTALASLVNASRRRRTLPSVEDDDGVEQLGRIPAPYGPGIHVVGEFDVAW